MFYQNQLINSLDSRLPCLEVWNFIWVSLTLVCSLRNSLRFSWNFISPNQGFGRQFLLKMPFISLLSYQKSSIHAITYMKILDGTLPKERRTTREIREWYPRAMEEKQWHLSLKSTANYVDFGILIYSQLTWFKQLPAVFSDAMNANVLRLQWLWNRN